MSEATDIRADLLAEVLLYGTTAVLTTFANDYSAATGINTVIPTSATIPCTDAYQRSRYFPNDTQPTAASLVTIPAEDLELVPEPGARLVLGGVTWTVTLVRPYALQAVTLAYEVTLLQGGAA